MLFLVIPLLGILAALVMIVQNERQRTTADVLDLPAEIERQAAALMNYTAPAFQVKDIDGKSVSLDEYKGRIVFLNFWTTDCPPCQREMPTFAQFASEQDEQGPAVLTVNMGDTPQMIQEFFTRIGVKGVRVAMDTDLAVGNRYSIIARPVTYVIDAQGVIRAMKAGEITIEDMDGYVAQITTTPRVN